MLIYRLLLYIAGNNPYSISCIVNIFSIYFLVCYLFTLKKYFLWAIINLTFSWFSEFFSYLKGPSTHSHRNQTLVAMLGGRGKEGEGRFGSLRLADANYFINIENEYV